MKNRKSSSFDSEIVQKNIEQYGSEHIRNSNIRVIRILSNIIESETGKKFIRLEMGVPGVKPSKYGIDAEIEALKSDVAGVYPPIDGIPELKHETSGFAKNFLDVDVSPASCLATVGSINGNYASFMLCGRRVRGQDTILFIDPGFPPQKQIARMLGLRQKSFDIYKHRGEKLRPKLEEMLEDKSVAAMIYSNPNNPSWMCFTDEELEIIAEMADKYNAIVIEDLAYFAMDFRKDLSKPGVPPYQNTVAKYTDNYILLISSSKIFSYAGQRIGMMLISDKLFNCRGFPYSTICFKSYVQNG
jgi:aspartate/methionine/tyrosine aminotransferase